MDLFSETDHSFPRRQLAARLAELAAQDIYVGTSSWKYPGWLGKLYDEQRYVVRKRFSQKKFQEDCLSEFAETFRAVCVDAGYYAFPTEEGMAKLTAAVPAGFRFAFKVTDDITIKHFPRLPRFGVRGGTDNVNFLNPALFAERFLAPCEPHRDKIGPLMFEFSTLHENDFARGRDFVEQLDRFLSRIPKTGWRYAVEVRNPSLLHPEYFSMLTSHGVAHVFNSWTRMPPVVEQLALPGCVTADFLVARFLLKPGRTFEQAVQLFAPYRDTGEVYNLGRQGIREIIDLGQTLQQALNKSGLAGPTGLSKRVPRFVFINNRLEGNALKTIVATILDQPF